MPYLENGTGHANTDTSIAAAKDMAPISGTIRERVLAVLHSTPFPLTADEIAKVLDIDFISVRPRVTELRNANRVKDSGVRRVGRFGKEHIAWELV